MKGVALAVRIAALLAGLAILYFTVRENGGFVAVFSQLAAFRGFALLVLLNSLCWMILYTEAWKTTFVDVSHRFGFFSLLRVKISGESINLMTPLGFFAGDPARVMLLDRYVTPEARLRSVVVDRVMHILATFAFCLMGTAVLFTSDFELPFWLGLSGISALVFYGLLFFLTATLVMRLLTGRGLGFIDRLVTVLGVPKRFPRLNQALIELRGDLLHFADKPKGPFWGSFLLHLAGRLLGAMEIAVIIYAYEGRMMWELSVVLAALTSFFLFVFGFVPGGLGVLEKLYAAFLPLFGLRPELGLTVQFIRRLRAVFWILIGVFFVDFQELMRMIRGRKKN